MAIKAKLKIELPSRSEEVSSEIRSKEVGFFLEKCEIFFHYLNPLKSTLVT